MLYAILSEDIADSLPLRQTARPAHLQRLEELQSQGRLLLAGPHPVEESQKTETHAFTGSLVIAEFDSLDAAQTWANDDPYLHAGVYKQVTVKPFKQVLPKP